jgi:diacylglycerol kinase (ATP)
MKLLLIFNAFAQSGRSKNLLKAILKAFTEYAIEFELAHTAGPGHATELAKGASRPEFDGVVSIGGDGTCFEVLNGLFGPDHRGRLPLGIVPMGTGNAFAREFELYPANWQEAVQRIASGNVRSVDVGHVSCLQDEFYFLNIIGMGFVTDAGLAARKFKQFGTAAYTLGTLKEIFRLKSFPLSLLHDGVQIEEESTFIEISNSRYTGTNFLIAPSARIDDGLLDITLLRKISRFRLLRLFPTIFSGRHVNFEEVMCKRAGEIQINSPEGKLLTVDGEFRGETPAEIKCLPGALQLLI